MRVRELRKPPGRRNRRRRREQAAPVSPSTRQSADRCRLSPAGSGPAVARTCPSEALDHGDNSFKSSVRKPRYAGAHYSRSGHVDYIPCQCIGYSRRQYAGCRLYAACWWICFLGHKSCWPPYIPANCSSWPEAAMDRRRSPGDLMMRETSLRPDRPNYGGTND